jgi:serine protease
MTSRSPKSMLFVGFIAFLLVSAGGAAAQQEGRYMIEFRNFAGAAATVRAAGGSPIYEFPELKVVAAMLPEQALRGLQNNPNVVLIERDPERYPMRQTTPYGIPMVQADQVSFDSTKAGLVKVCIIDSGYYAAHEDLQTANVTYTTDSKTGDAKIDGCGHGTHVAGTIAALNNTAGVIGVVPTGALQLHIVKVFGNDCKWAYSSDLVHALNQCTGAGAKVINMSLGGSFSSTTENNAFSNAYNSGVLSIAAAGNDGSTRKSYPASYASVISVAAIDSNKTVASFSQKNDAVELAAPGVGVLSTVSWKSSTVTSVSGTYNASNIDGSARTDATGTLVDGGLCGSAGAWNGNVVLCERGTYSFADKVNAVKSGGGVGAIIYNNVSGGFAGTLNGTSTIPAVSISREDGLLVKNDVNQSATVSNSTGTGSGYEAWDGTSMATPHVAGVAALVWSKASGKSNADVRKALQVTAQDLGASGKDNSYGYGLVQAKAALDYLGGGSTPTNNPPTANFTYSCTDLTCNFTDTSTDSDGSISSRAWTFGDGTSSTATNPSKTYTAGGTYSVTLTVTDNGGATGTTSKSVTVTAPSTGGITLSATGYKVKGVQHADLTWSGASGSVDIKRNGVIVKTVSGTAYTDNIGNKGGGSYQYQVCNAGSSTCSNTVTVSF